jgi:predicted methyltransferase
VLRNFVPYHYLRMLTLYDIMSKFGETIDRILEMIQNGDKVYLKTIRDRLMLSDTAIFKFMNEFGLIELNEGTVRITKPGLELLVLGHLN